MAKIAPMDDGCQMPFVLGIRPPGRRLTQKTTKIGELCLILLPLILCFEDFLSARFDCFLNVSSL